jgi:hypothetical protein
MANARNLARLHFAPAERHDTTAPVPPPQNCGEVPPGSVLLERPAPRLEGGGFVRDRGEYSFRQGPPELSSGWAPGLARDYGRDFREMAAREQMMRLYEMAAGQEKARFGGVSNPQPPPGDSL